MCTYLAKRGATYYFRRVISVELRPAFDGKTEFMLSLRTKDRATAKGLIPDKTKETNQLLSAARTRLGIGAAQATPLPVVHGPSEWEREQSELREQDEAERQARWDAREPLRERLLAAFELSTAQITPKEAAMRDLLRDVQADLTIEQERRLARRVERAEAPPSGQRGNALPIARRARTERAGCRGQGSGWHDAGYHYR